MDDDARPLSIISKNKILSLSLDIEADGCDKRPPQEMVPLGEIVLFKELRASRPGNREMRFEKGVWLSGTSHQ